MTNSSVLHKIYQKILSIVIHKKLDIALAIPFLSGRKYLRTLLKIIQWADVFAEQIQTTANPLYSEMLKTLDRPF